MLAWERLRRWWRKINHKPAVLALHGFAGSAGDIEPVIQASLGECQWWALQLPGHGQGEPIEEPLTLASFLDLVETARKEIVDATGEPPMLLGYSMGGRLALHAALQNPEKWRALVTIGATPGLDDPAEREARQQADAELAARMRRQSIDEFLGEWQAKPIIRSQENIPRRIRDAMTQRRRENDPAALARVLETLSPGTLPSLWDELPRLTIPCLFVAGEDDPKFSAIAERMAAAVPNARTAIIHNAGHCAHLENTPRFTPELLRFLNEVKKSGA